MRLHALLQRLRREELSRRSDVSVDTIGGFQKGRNETDAALDEAIRQKPEAAGVVFTARVGVELRSQT